MGAYSRHRLGVCLRKRLSKTLLKGTHADPAKETVEIPPKEGNSNSNASGAPPENGDTPIIKSVEGGSSELPTDLNSEPLLSSFGSMSIQENGIPIESVASRDANCEW